MYLFIVNRQLEIYIPNYISDFFKLRFVILGL